MKKQTPPIKLSAEGISADHLGNRPAAKVSKIILRVGERGRVTLPPLFRLRMKLLPGTKLEAVMEDGHLVLRHLSDRCVVCGRKGPLEKLDNLYLCPACYSNSMRQLERTIAELLSTDEEENG